MKIQYIIIAIIFLACSHEDAIVTGFVIANDASNMSPVLSEISPVDDSNNSSTPEVVEEKPTLLIQPRLLIAKNPVVDNTNASDAPQEPQILSAVTLINTTVAEDATQDNGETVKGKPAILIEPLSLTAEKPIGDNTNESDAPQEPQILPAVTLINKTVTEDAIQDNGETVKEKPTILIEPLRLTAEKPVSDNINESNAPQQPQVLPVVTSVKTIGTGNATQDNNGTVEKKPKIRILPRPLIAKRPLDYDTNRLNSSQQPQVLPSVKTTANPKCNTSACPKYKCATYLIPANLTAGECCDHCAPASVKPTVATKTTSKPKKNSGKLTKIKPPPPPPPPPSSSSSSEDEESSSGEQYDGKPVGCNIRPFNPKPNRSRSQLIRLLTEALAHFRRLHSQKQHNDSDK